MVTIIGLVFVVWTLALIADIGPMWKSTSEICSTVAMLFRKAQKGHRMINRCNKDIIHIDKSFVSMFQISFWNPTDDAWAGNVCTRQQKIKRKFRRLELWRVQRQKPSEISSPVAFWRLSYRIEISCALKNFHRTSTVIAGLMDS